MKHIYLDFNTTTPLAPSVGEAMQPFWDEHFLLPTQQHPAGLALGELVDTAREQVANLMGCDPFEVVFTSGGTEANNLAILGVCRAWQHAGKPPGRVIVSATEHDSVIAAANSLQFDGWHIEYLDVDSTGRVDPEQLEAMLQPDTVLVCLQAACSISGVLQPVRQVADICHARGVLLHCDAAQIAGKQPIDTGSLRADTIAISGHKMYGPKGIGALYVRRGLKLSPILYGEASEMGLRPGSGNITGEIGLGAAARMAARGAEDATETMAALRDRFEQRIKQSVAPTPRVWGDQVSRLPNTSLITLPIRVSNQFNQATSDLVICRPRCPQPQDWMTRSLVAFGLTEQQIACTIRVSVGWTTSQETIDQAANHIILALEN
ncbi:Cysteine desulfurase [Rosistilla carotiformis]|uniref:Cysteine desulfurase n=1 Tax=Rosistilla carotiformis TaxID=2528017 RepID=A0A518JTB7_9BACT|nr:cysteine desulfurase family protein [Rosistilla carotiformis]QDV68786.1 Cysteine desulfurase [Rosistilla carotiformis]